MDTGKIIEMTVMKKLLAAMMAVVLCVCLVGCERTSEIAYRSTTNLEPVPFGDDLYYDVQTKVVYMMFGQENVYQGYGYMSAYYAPNGLPYLYDANNQALVEIEPNW